MNARRWATGAVLGLMMLAPPASGARGLNVEVWTDRGDDAVYQPEEALEVRARASDDAYLLVYEIDAEGYVRLLYPYRGGSGFVEGRRTYSVPPERANVELVVERGSVGQCYVVAIAARDRFRELPWYLHPYDLQGEHVGYAGSHDDEEGITAEGRIVGDPFVAMERIRRRVVGEPDDPDAFATSYATYYVHEQVRYPRYLCYDCHRPGRWAWWTGFDPYYTHCSVFDFRINWHWGWGPGYWFGSVPYYYYVVRPDCPPYYRPWYQKRAWFSSWDGWRRWKPLWGDRLIRFKSDPPAGYVPPSRYPDRGTWRDGRSSPPGFVVTGAGKSRGGSGTPMVIGRSQESRPHEESRQGTGVGRRVGSSGKPGAQRLPGRDLTPRGGGTRRPDPDLGGGGRTPSPRREPIVRDRGPRREEPSAREAPARGKSRPAETPRYEMSRKSRSDDRPRETRSSGPRDRGRAPDPGRGSRHPRG